MAMSIKTGLKIKTRLIKKPRERAGGHQCEDQHLEFAKMQDFSHSILMAVCKIYCR